VLGLLRLVALAHRLPDEAARHRAESPRSPGLDPGPLLPARHRLSAPAAQCIRGGGDLRDGAGTDPRRESNGGAMSTVLTENRPAAGSENGHQPDKETLVCPVCGGENPPDAVFCGNTECRKALGDFKYVLEELREEAKWHEALAERVV